MLSHVSLLKLSALRKLAAEDLCFSPFDNLRTHAVTGDMFVHLHE